MSLFTGDNIADMLGAGGAYYLGNEASDIAREGGEVARNLANGSGYYFKSRVSFSAIHCNKQLS